MNGDNVDATVANSAPSAAQAPQPPNNNGVEATARAADTATDSAASGARAAGHTALADHLKYTLTVPQAQDRFKDRRRWIPSERTLQDYCQNGKIAGLKIRTSFDGKAREEWLMNEESLNDFIEMRPEIQPAADTAEAIEPAPQASHAPQTMLVSVAEPAAAATASAARVAEDAQEIATEPVGETRTLARVLIENAKLLSTVEGKDAVIAEKNQLIVELKDDRSFLREEVREGRKTRDDVKAIASQMLETIKSMAMPRLPQPPPQQPPPAKIWEQEGQSGQNH